MNNAGKTCHEKTFHRELYANMPLHYASHFKGCKNDNFYMKNEYFSYFAQNIDYGCMLEPPH